MASGFMYVIFFMNEDLALKPKTLEVLLGNSFVIMKDKK